MVAVVAGRVGDRAAVAVAATAHPRVLLLVVVVVVVEALPVVAVAVAEAPLAALGAAGPVAASLRPPAAARPSGKVVTGRLR